MGSEGEEKQDELEFLRKLENLNANYVLYHIENMYPTLKLPTNFDKMQLCDFFQGHVNVHLRSRQEMIPEGIDLVSARGVVKHYSYSELSPYIDHIKQDYVFGNTPNGRFLHGYVDYHSLTKFVVIKTLDLRFPPRPEMKWQPRRLHNEIMFLKNLNTHPNLPHLIGYSIDKKLALVYDMKPSVTLFEALAEDSFGWDNRLKVAIQVANLMKDFHEMEITLGSIDSVNILLDQDGNITLCEFGFTARMREMKYEKDPKFYIAGRYNYLAPELHVSEGDRWPLQSDIFAFGLLLLDLITKKRFEPSGMENWLYKVLDDNKSKSGNFSLVDESLLDDPNIGCIITHLVVKCVHENLACRPTADFVYNQVKKLAENDFGSKKRKSYS